MAINFLSSVNFNDNEILGAAIQNLGTDPAAGVLGQLYFNTSDDVLSIECQMGVNPKQIAIVSKLVSVYLLIY